MTKVIVLFNGKRIVLSFNSFNQAAKEAAHLASIGYDVTIR